MTAIATPRHRVSVATAHVHAELDTVADASVWSMDAAETARPWSRWSGPRPGSSS